MPRFHLRTLLIVVPIVSLPLARIAYLKRMRDFHRGEVARLAPIIATTEDERLFRVAESITALANGATGRERYTKQVKVGKNRLIFAKEQGAVFATVEPVPLLNTAVRHQIMANRFDRAMYRPWTSVSDSSTP